MGFYDISQMNPEISPIRQPYYDKRLKLKKMISRFRNHEEEKFIVKQLRLTIFLAFS